MAIVCSLAGCTRAPAPPPPSASSSGPLKIERDTSPAGPVTAQPQLTASGGGVILSWQASDAGDTALMFAERTDTGWSPAKTVVSRRDLFANWADLPSVMDGFKRFLGYQPDARIAVLAFGLFHGFGLATKLQDFSLPQRGLVTNIVSFNIGVEIGQVLALTAVLLALTYWRTRPGFARYAFATNTALMTGGFLLIGRQLAGYFLSA